MVIGWLVCVFVHRAPSLGIKAVSTLAAIVGGGAALAVWRFSLAAPLPDEANAYFIGAFISILARGIFMRTFPGFD